MGLCTVEWSVGTRQEDSAEDYNTTYLCTITAISKPCINFVIIKEGGTIFPVGFLLTANKQLEHKDFGKYVVFAYKSKHLNIKYQMYITLHLISQNGHKHRSVATCHHHIQDWTHHIHLCFVIIIAQETPEL